MRSGGPRPSPACVPIIAAIAVPEAGHGPLDGGPVEPALPEDRRGVADRRESIVLLGRERHFDRVAVAHLRITPSYAAVMTVSPAGLVQTARDSIS